VSKGAESSGRWFFEREGLIAIDRCSVSLKEILGAYLLELIFMLDYFSDKVAPVR